ncbi:dTDP-4-dehydrorhamnose reductase [Bradyrhizobium sp. 147]|uniref:dTDP-4-dehydrorhamnose reductase n=1 Tax=unclassified Bradyrhizobium TaxID=2631580 RepID=UPI001FF8E466|nr:MULTISPECIES: dTDP-4-dehydrorhamnose reductase [unclassified Bradyrhizobium]MCK1682380.1 dTDP-4-dehydrorhamnose reductase [Bradyrhizobium sp. 147]MCK1757027.1 dTDP-4-dehydrorhamnose reductase [Bradyrhizobium sp. 137]
MTERPIFIAGRNGQLARCLHDLAVLHSMPVVSLGRSELNLETHGELRRAIDPFAPSMIINAAAYTAVDLAESEVARAFSINRDAAAALADVAWQMNIPFIQISTDYVFDGTKLDAYEESDVPAPMNVYGASKLAGEAAVLAAHPLATVIRTSWLYSPHGNNFVRTMLRLCESQPVVRVVQDQCGNPTSALDLASAILQLSARLLTRDRRAMAGIFHLAGQGETTWHGFAQAIFDLLAHRGIRVPQLEAITSEQYQTAARRPRNSRLDSSKAERVLGIRLPLWRCSLETCLDQLPEGRIDAERNCAGWWQRNSTVSNHESGEQAATAHL